MLVIFMLIAIVLTRYSECHYVECRSAISSRE
jgi:hypothetical protein